MGYAPEPGVAITKYHRTDARFFLQFGIALKDIHGDIAIPETGLHYTYSDLTFKISDLGVFGIVQIAKPAQTKPTGRVIDSDDSD